MYSIKKSKKNQYHCICRYGTWCFVMDYMGFGGFSDRVGSLDWFPYISGLVDCMQKIEIGKIEKGCQGRLIVINLYDYTTTCSFSLRLIILMKCEL